ncbi:2-succinyl-5-enolpyruvyl-6-hydroxy-3-cyclohexene-1-carboxylic-acid synthase [Photobacterium sanctipauli]|uniref:2-succinyl-5-enolpyruvyl-6-hydroxy-3-cyclohexene-1-carboxylate synthase n=1 Tax=Photobacterium sanctipauli TaxID=1342794 RepID=A0A2T3NXM3_9GAMM|nr:2-succinyl-5-enolpyruvyl-6-hydroxy-3-cyclohexene-1-carboxylic-acid synthase [Photobacterium sanctipauli]PSW21006.1 2-succinyl-5-enolpyruvyl-6-hydroxy-3-cyclohexene-1-carboxylic-acid synthase [Photobacterium sanctipauli]
MMAQQHRAALNQLWAGLMLEELARLGVEHVCIAPGSRSTPLTLAADRNEKLTIHTHFDERGLGFMALGLAKSTQTPVAVVVTSGTAVANLLPAVAESGLTGEKLVMLTSDRPPELIQCGANQAIRQHGIFSSHVTEFLDVPSPSTDISPAWLLGSVDTVMYQQQLRGGAVHFNCHYPEPLYGDAADFTQYLQPVGRWQQSALPYTAYQDVRSPVLMVDQSQWQSLRQQKGVIVAGRLEPGEFAHVAALAKQLGWPLLADPQAGGSSEWAGFDVWLQNPACHEHLSQADVLLQFGGRLVSKRLGQFIAGTAWQHYWLVDPLSTPLDPTQQCSMQIKAKSGDYALQLMAQQQADGAIAFTPPFSGWADNLKAASSQYLGHLLQTHTELNEVSLAANMMDWLPDNAELFLGNSLIVRLLDMCGKVPGSATFANRGASGIDGLIATAAGVQQGRQAPLFCVLGDTSLLYDLNSLALLRQASQPVVILVTNNDGGAIFDMLPVPEAQKENLYRMPHGLEFSHAAAMFGLDYVRPASLAEAEQACRDGFASRSATLIEVQTPAGESGQLLKALFAEVRHASLL